ncbi:LamG-like jellyroll fold domain-containing protein [Nucisporomicrobium flavum]|jgi:Concanavalin A-like lectin/glucanases superfamily|uniref:LamG-like jellyroll fold domain-containing protein n=1 Tax=Nucisporomicrobium flavum TaxID=2785915 RepID=UPI0018F5A86E|nr:LamG-like jellyroll fold domain-containing protein [Nucisporomicrobium flavum]
MHHHSRITALALSLPALAAAALPAPALAAPAAPAAPVSSAPVTVARYTFDTGTVGGGRIADRSGRGSALTVRRADGGSIHFNGTTSDKYAAFPAPCAASASACPRVLLEGTDDADLDPGTRLFRWGATVRLTKAQVTDSSNVMQKGVADTDSQWKMQIGANQGKAQCVVVGTGSERAEPRIVRSTIGIADNKWHTVMCQRSRSTLTVYIDGTARGKVTIPATLSISNNLPLRIGGPNFHTRSDMFHGLLDDVWARVG